MNQIKKSIKYLVMDVDGTLTDGKIYMGVNGEVMKAFNIKDGYGIAHILPKHNIIPIVITARKSNIVLNRCKELGIIHCYQGVEDKVSKLKELAEEFQCTVSEEDIIEQMAYIGDDLIDIPAMKCCFVKACPADAVEEVKILSDYICKSSGGNGAVREFIEWLAEG